MIVRDTKGPHRPRVVLVWTALALAVSIPLALATTSPWLAYRNGIYIAASFAGILALALLLVQPLLIGGWLPGIPALGGRRLHRWVGGLLVGAVAVHVGGLWITSPPDVIDALLFASPTPFSAWGVVAMWAIFAVALLAALRRPLRIGPRSWRLVHALLAVVIVLGTVVHSLLVEGTMETISKAALCGLVVTAAAVILARLPYRAKAGPLNGRRAGSSGAGRDRSGRGGAG